MELRRINAVWIVQGRTGPSGARSEAGQRKSQRNKSDRDAAYQKFHFLPQELKLADEIFLRIEEYCVDLNELQCSSLSEANIQQLASDF